MSIKKQCDGQGLNPGHPDSEVEVLTALPHMPPQSFKMRLNAKSFLTENEFMSMRIKNRFHINDFALALLKVAKHSFVGGQW